MAPSLDLVTKLSRTGHTNHENVNARLGLSNHPGPFPLKDLDPIHGRFQILHFLILIYQLKMHPFPFLTIHRRTNQKKRKGIDHVPINRNTCYVPTTTQNKNFMAFHLVAKVMPKWKYRPKVNYKRARRIVKAVTGITLVKRVVLDTLTIPAETAANFDNALTVDLLECVEAMDEEVESNGTAIADIPLYSRLTGFKFNFGIVAGSANQVFRWALYKKPDGEAIMGTDLSDTAGLWHSSNDTPTAREVRKMLIAKGMLISNAASSIAYPRIFAKPAAMKRISPFREGDKLTFLIAQNTATNSVLHGFGTMWVRANG